MHYRAFISHSHADAKFAAWLQRAIETWRVPTRLRSELGYNRIKPIFRDRTDLRAATSLGDALEDALKHSSALIVVCSNEAADSDWVDQEIACYREFNPDAPILPIIASGEPPHCFPESLLVDANGNALEPLAADARKGFDGKRDALLKTIAGIIDVDFDVLKQRDFRRRQQKMGAVAALSTVIAAVTLYLAYVAYEARDDANRRREQADDLIAFMLGDLREKLEPIGRLDVLDAVGDEALNYFAGFDSDDLTFDVALKNAIALRQLGEVEVAKSRYSKALEAFGQAEKILADLDLQNPRSPTVGEQRYLVEYWIGLVHQERSQWDSAREHFLTYRKVAKETYDSSGVHSHLVEYLYSQQNLGVLELKAGNLSIAAQYFSEALAELDSGEYYDIDSPEFFDLRSTLLSWSGEVAWLRSETEKAFELYQQEYEAIERIREVDDAKLYEELSLQALTRIAAVHLYLGRTQEAESIYGDVYSSTLELVAFDVENAYWLRLLTTAGLGYAQALHANSRIADARDILEQLRVYGLRLFRIDPENATNAKQYALVLLEKAKIDICQFEVDSAQQALAAAREVFLSFELDPPQDELLYASILSETIASDIALLMQSSHQAQMHWSEAKQLAAYPDSSFDPLQSILIERVSGLESVQLLNTGQRSVDELDKQSTITENLVAHALAGGSWKVH